MDQWLRGKRRHLWLSDSSALIEDARRDWQALGGTPLDIQPFGRVRPGAGIEIGGSILFASYATLRSEAGGDRRVDQLLAWLSEERSEERRVGKECIRTCRSRLWRSH